MGAISPPGKNLQFTLSAGYVAPHPLDVRLEALLRRLYVLDKLELSETTASSEAAVYGIDDTHQLTEAPVYFIVIGAPEFFPPGAEDSIEIEDPAFPIVALSSEDLVRCGDGGRTFVDIRHKDTTTLLEIVEAYHKHHGNPWGLVRGKVQEYQER